MVLRGRAGRQDRVFGNEQKPLRPQFFQPINCRNVLIEGVHLHQRAVLDDPGGLLRERAGSGITIANEGPNNDGFNADSCRNVVRRTLHVRHRPTIAWRSNRA